MSNNIVLIGFMGAGKTTIGREVAKLCNSMLFDTDKMIEANYDMSVNEIFGRFGEEYFRECEVNLCNFIRDNVKNAVISTGGGIPMRYNLKKLGVVFYLKAPLEALIERVEDDTINMRPLFSRFEIIGDLYNDRIREYEVQADYIINALDDISEISNKIYSYIKGN
ncbi:shikimate kinase [Helicobacter sp. MIT 14-3879]|uniref:shikimate kinase n=1 Tax=Helicobacter sp. MIT 14-3879 TaxID=2040649 RepID=UPI000E1F531B|nr:shikimate kinase [Helicobacter sp. MIT 14-3879]RDU64660.1 shikimate kinase [Helicobacter sp. MIT 14-3879]